MKNDRLWRWLTPLSFVLFVGSIFLLSKYLTVVIALALSVSLHELAHLYFVRKYGFRARMIFVPFLGAAVIPLDEYNSYSSLQKDKKAMIAIAGPLLNTILVLIGLLAGLTSILPNFFYDLVVINLILVAINIAPIAPFDGGKIAEALVQSIRNPRTQKGLTYYMMASSLASMLPFLFGYNNLGASLAQPSLVNILFIVMIGALTYFVVKKYADPHAPRVVITDERRYKAIIAGYALTSGIGFVVFFISLFGGTILHFV